MIEVTDDDAENIKNFYDVLMSMAAETSFKFNDAETDQYRWCYSAQNHAYLMAAATFYKLVNEIDFHSIVDKRAMRINRYLQLEEDWDGYGASRISERAIELAITILPAIPTYYSIFPTKIGGVGFQSCSGVSPFLMLKINPDGQLYSYLEKKDGPCVENTDDNFSVDTVAQYVSQQAGEDTTTGTCPCCHKGEPIVSFNSGIRAQIDPIGEVIDIEKDGTYMGDILANYCPICGRELDD